MTEVEVRINKRDVIKKPCRMAELFTSGLAVHSVAGTAAVPVKVAAVHFPALFKAFLRREFPHASKFLSQFLPFFGREFLQADVQVFQLFLFLGRKLLPALEAFLKRLALFQRKLAEMLQPFVQQVLPGGGEFFEPEESFAQFKPLFGSKLLPAAVGVLPDLAL